MSDVRFIRINGRVVPIRDRKKDMAKGAVAGAALGGAYGAGKMGSAYIKKYERAYKFGFAGNRVTSKLVGVSKTLNKSGLKKMGRSAFTGSLLGLGVGYLANKVKQKTGG